MQVEKAIKPTHDVDRGLKVEGEVSRWVGVHLSMGSTGRLHMRGVICLSTLEIYERVWFSYFRKIGLTVAQAFQINLKV